MYGKWTDQEKVSKGLSRRNISENVDGYLAYRRRNDGRMIQTGSSIAYNSLVVSYNSFLLKKYKAHVYLEACSSIKSVTYLFKYIYKGHDCANMELVPTRRLH